MIKLEKITYVREGKGQHWNLQEKEYIDDYSVSLFQERIVAGVGFFRGLGGTERVSRSEFKVTSISPDNTIKVIYQLVFE